MRGETVRDSLRFAAACGGLSTRGLGGTATQPDENEVRRFLLMQPRVELAQAGAWRLEPVKFESAK
jgi:hypothetical protein